MRRAEGDPTMARQDVEKVVMVMMMTMTMMVTFLIQVKGPFCGLKLIKIDRNVFGRFFNQVERSGDFLALPLNSSDCLKIFRGDFSIKLKGERSCCGLK